MPLLLVVELPPAPVVVESFGLEEDEDEALLSSSVSAEGGRFWVKGSVLLLALLPEEVEVPRLLAPSRAATAAVGEGGTKTDMRAVPPGAVMRTREEEAEAD